MRARLSLVPFLVLALAACQQASTDSPVATDTAQAAAAPAGLPETEAMRAEHWWTCGDVPISTQLKGEMLMLSGPFGERSLPPQKTVSGVRYADDKGNEFWPQGEAAMLKVDWKEMKPCTADEPAAAAG